MKMWEFDNYDVYEEADVLRFEDKEGNLLGYVSFNEYKDEIMNDLNNGANPITDKWEDGIGNIITIEGWGIIKMEKDFYDLLEEEGKELDYDRVEVTFNLNSIDVMEIDSEGYNLYGETYYNVYDAYDRLVEIGAL